jgi:radical SAM superfamily enzyme
MKVNITIDITPDEVKELFTPNENQTKLWSDLTMQIISSMTEQVNKNYGNFAENYFDNIQKSQKEFFEQFTKK